MNVTISTSEELESFLNTKNPLFKRGNIYIDGVTIRRKDFMNLNKNHDPKVLHFNNCNFVDDDCFESSFCCATGIYDFAITNSHLTSLQGISIINGLHTKELEYLDLSNNDLGKVIIDNELNFLKYFKYLFNYYFSLESIVLTNNGFSKEERSDFLSYVIDHFRDLELVTI